MKKFFYLVFGFYSFVTLAQDREYFLPISTVDSREGTRIQVTVPYGTEVGLTPGMECSVWGLHYSDYPDHNKSTLATGRIVSVTDTASVAVLEEAFTDEVRLVYAGDLLQVRLPDQAAYRGIFSDIIAYAVYFNDQNNESINYFYDVYRQDSPEFEAAMLDRMVEDIVSLADYLVGTIEDQDISGGLYAGDTMLGAMQKTNRRDLMSFLRYVTTYPANYMGKQWKIAEVYATWLINDTPLVSSDIGAMIDELGAEADFQKIHERYGALIDADHILDAGIAAENWLEAGDTTRAQARMAGVISLAELSQEPDELGWAYFQMGRYHYLLDEDAEGLEWYLKSSRAFEQTQNQDGLSFSYNNAASCYENLKEYELAVEFFQKALAAKQKMYAEQTTDKYLSDVATAYKRVGDAMVKATQYDSAQRQYRRAVEIHAQLKNNEKRWEVMEELAEAMGYAGDIDGGAAVQAKRREEAQAVGNEKVAADATFDIGYMYNGVGNRFEEAIPHYQKSYELHMALGDTSMAALSISNVAQTYWSLKQLDLSIENHLRTIALAEAFGEKDRLANSWDKLADLYAENGNPKSSLDAYDKVIALYEEMNDPKLSGTLKEVGDVYKSAKDYLKAVSYYRRSVEMARKNGDFVQSSDALYSIADAYYTDKKYDLAKHFYEESMADAAKTNYPSQEIYCLANLALIYSLKDQYEKSDSLYTYALNKAIELEDNSIIGFCKYRLAGSAARKRDYPLAEKLYKESLALYESQEDKTWQVIVLNALSGIHTNRGEFDAAIAMLDKALTIAEENGDRGNQAYAYVYKSDIYLRIFGEFDKAWEMMDKSYGLFNEVDNTWGIADTYLGYGNISNLRGNNVDAIRYYQKADSLYAILGNEYARATPMNNMGTIYYAQYDYEKALDHFQKAIAILDKLGIKDASRSLYTGNIGEVKMEQGKYEEAEKWLNTALAEAQEINDVNQISTTMVIMGRLKLESGKHDEARQFLLDALQMQEKMGLKTHEISTRFSLGKLAYIQKREADYKYLDESIERAEQMGYERELWEAYYHKGLIAKDKGDLEVSKEMLINSVEALEKLQGRMVGGEEAKKIFSSGEKQIKVYGALVDVLIAKGEVELGMQYLERGNAEALRSKFKQLNITFKDEEANEKLAKERELKMKLDNLSKALVDEKSGASSEEKLKVLEQSKTIAENEYLKFVNTTISTNPELSRHFSGGFHPRKLKTDKNRQLIPENLVVLSYLPANDKLYIFSATSDTVVAKVVEVSQEELNKNIKFLHNFASHAIGGHQTDPLRVARGNDRTPPPRDFNSNESKYKQTSEQLYNWVIAPVKDELAKKEMVVVVPTGMLHFLPFQMLGEQLDNGKFDFLIEHYTLFYAHSLEMLYQQKERITDISILAMANADKSLPAAEQEVMDLRDLYPNTEVYIHENASEDKAKTSTGKHNILHFATHGNLDYFDYHKSYLTLAPDESGVEDGKLTIEEVWEIEDIFSYQMVTLSACKTAVTDDLNTGWPVSPATSFIDAGAPTVVASLWSVNDESTAILMKYFYRNLQTMSKVEALRRAQIELSQHEKFSHPHYWAPFILIGDWR